MGFGGRGVRPWLSDVASRWGCFRRRAQRRGGSQKQFPDPVVKIGVNKRGRIEMSLLDINQASVFMCVLACMSKDVTFIARFTRPLKIS